MNHYIWVDPNQGHPLQARNMVHPRKNMHQEGVNPLTQVLLRWQGRPILAYRPETIHKDSRELGRYRYGTQSLRHQQRWPLGARVDHGVQVGKVQQPAASPGPLRLMPGWNPDLASRAETKGLKWKYWSGA